MLYFSSKVMAEKREHMIRHQRILLKDKALIESDKTNGREKNNPIVWNKVQCGKRCGDIKDIA